MIKVLENMGPRDRWQEVRDSIIRIDRVNTMGGAYLSTQTKQTGALLQPGKGKTCDICGRKGHIKITCRIPKEKLKCTHCKNEGSHATAACKSKKKSNSDDTPPKATGPKDNMYAKTGGKRGSTPKRGGRATPHGKSPADGDSSNVVEYRLREEFSDSDSGSEESCDDYTTPPETPGVIDSGTSCHNTDTECPSLANSDSDSDSDSDSSTGLRALCPNPKMS